MTPSVEWRDFFVIRRKIPDEVFIGVYAYGFERPSAIQQRAIMPIIKGKFIHPEIF